MTRIHRYSGLERQALSWKAIAHLKRPLTSLGSSSTFDVTPSARRLTTSLRDIGYDFQSALADVIDNSIAAGADRVDVEIQFAGEASYVAISDNGSGMTDTTLREAMRFGSRRTYESGELGRYGLGLKTASISQCRSLTVLSRRAPVQCRISTLTLDLDHVEAADRWEVTEPHPNSIAYDLVEELSGGPGTIVVWEKLDRMLGPKPASGGAHRRLNSLRRKARAYLGMVFHRFIEGSAEHATPLTLTVNGEKVDPWNPFAPLEAERVELPPLTFEIPNGSGFSPISLHRYVLPPRGSFSSAAEFDRMSGPRKWNRQQGLYVYRADRLIQHGGWAGIRALDEHTKYGRAALEVPTELDEMFQINVAKMRVAIPPEVRTMLERPINELCHMADATYRGDARSREEPKRNTSPKPEVKDSRDIGAALISAALNSGHHEEFLAVMANLRIADPQIARSLGW